MTKWEYRAIRVVSPDGNEYNARKRAQAEQGWSDLQTHTAIGQAWMGWINELGDQGWEAVGIVRDAAGGAEQGLYTILFKRPKD